MNPWPASPILLGISHKHYALRMAATLAAQGLRGRILLGNHGTVDLVLHKETEIVTVGADGAITEDIRFARGPGAGRPFGRVFPGQVPPMAGVAAGDGIRRRGGSRSPGQRAPQGGTISLGGAPLVRRDRGRRGRRPGRGQARNSYIVRSGGLRHGRQR